MSKETASRSRPGQHSLGALIDTFGARLASLGYAPLTVRGKLCFVRQLTRGLRGFTQRSSTSW